MKICVIIPTYWTSSSPAIQRNAPDAIYDHPTPLESQTTLPRLLGSIKATDLPRESLKIFVIAAVTHQALEEKAGERADYIVGRYKDFFDIKLFSASTLRNICAKDTHLSQLLSFYGYSNIRNIGLATGQILESDIVIFLDDDVVINDKTYFVKASEHVGKNIGCKMLGGTAGYYIDQYGDYNLYVDPKAWWKLWWPKEKRMNKAFKIIENERRLTETTFAFGGNMVLYWKMFEKVPFDPYITRGEDMDLLVNAKLFGFKFMLDTQLRVIHLPGEGKAVWSEMRQDLFRFLYMRQKLLSQQHANDTGISIDSLSPYPGHFLRLGVCLKFGASSCLNCLHSFLGRDLESLREFALNFGLISSASRFAAEHSLGYFEFQRKWASYLPRLRGNRRLMKVLQRS